MIIPPTDAATASGATTGTGGTTATDPMGKDTFLQLMVAQLRNQDPMNPTDSAEFLAQTAQFTSLEKMEEVASQTAQLFSAQMAFGASSLVGKTVSYTADDGSQASGAVGAVRFTDTGPVLEVDGTDVPVNNVVAVGDVTQPGSATDGSTGTDSSTGGDPSTGSTTDTETDTDSGSTPSADTPAA